MKIYRLAIAATLTLSLWLLAFTAAAGQATVVVEQRQSELFRVIAQPKSSARQHKLRALFDASLAYPEFARKSLGKQWAKRSESERVKFSALLTKLVRNNYKRNLEKMLDYDMSYVGEQQKGDATVVLGRAKHKTDAREPVIEIDFAVASVGGKLMIVDIITERASLVKTYKSQFLRIIRKHGFDKLIEKMQKKVDKQAAKG